MPRTISPIYWFDDEHKKVIQKIAILFDVVEKTKQVFFFILR